jgi:hypothetical protein
MPHRRALALLAALLPAALLLLGLRPALLTLPGAGPWGPEDPWRNGDVAGAWWWWWAAHRLWRGGEIDALVNHPTGLGALGATLPNPVQLGLLGALSPPTPLAWNLLLLGHSALHVIATQRLCRAAGAGPGLAAGAAALVAASPLCLHELAGGRPDSLPMWPALFAWALALRGGPRAGALAGALIGLQGVLYLWHGLIAALVALLLRPAARSALPGLIGGAVVFLPYLLWLWPALHAGAALNLPPAGYTSQPLAGLFVADDLPERFLAHPALLVGALLLGARRGGRGLLLAGLLVLALSLGPTLRWRPGEEGLVGPLAWLQWAAPALRRLHHPARAAGLALPLLAAALAAGLRRPGRAGWASGALLVGLALPRLDGLGRVGRWEAAPAPPYAALAAARAGGGPVIDLLGMEHRTALLLQTVHGRPLAEPFAFRRTGPWAAELDALARGQPPAPDLFARLAAAGFTELWVLPRFGEGDAARARVEAALGPAEGGAWTLPPP